MSVRPGTDEARAAWVARELAKAPAMTEATRQALRRLLTRTPPAAVGDAAGGAQRA